MPYVPTWKERLEEVQRYVMPTVAGLILVGLASWLVWHELLPHAERKPVTQVSEPAALLAARQQAAKEVDVAEKTYRRALESGAGEAALAAQLDRVIGKQRELMKLEPQVSTEQGARLARLEAERGTLRASVAAARSLSMEREATTAQANGHGAVALEKLREALSFQREANANAPTPDQKGLQREAHLALAIETAEAEPLHSAVEMALTLARSATAGERWEDAIKAFGEARLAQSELNQRFPDTRYADAAALVRFDGEIASFKATGAASLIATREREGDAAAVVGKPQEAGVAYAAAAELQADLNERFARSRFVSTAQVEELRVKRDTVLSAEGLARIAELDREATAELGRRQVVPAGEKIVAAAALMEKVAADFPRSRGFDRVLRQKLAYLVLRRADVEALHELVYSELAAMPGLAGLKMLRTEVSQEIYSRVMNINPSRNAGRALPVDSVSWEDAQEFCRRLSWLLGARVRLPTEAEFRRIFGETKGAWSLETSGGHSHETAKSPPSAAGFFDVAGNLAEWLQASVEVGETAPVAGGSYLDAAADLQSLRIERTEKRERARHIGFRFVVEFPAG